MRNPLGSCRHGPAFDLAAVVYIGHLTLSPCISLQSSSIIILSMGPEEFDVLVERAFKKIPRRFRRRLANVVLVVEQEPPRPNLLGLYQGRPLTHRSVSEGFALPDKITIYQGPHERTARTPSQLEQLVEETVWHEIAHYFGLDEREVRRAEIRRRHLR